MKSPAQNANSEVRKSEWFDRSKLHDMDIKCFDDVWEPTAWYDWLDEDRVVYIAEFDTKAVGFAACMILRDGIFIEKIGIKPAYRRRGVSKDLLLAVFLHSQLQAWPYVVSTTVPETFLSPGDPEDISGWLDKVGFKAKPPLEPDYFHINGEYVNGVPCIFEDE